jgi:hypothetical protein
LSWAQNAKFLHLVCKPRSIQAKAGGCSASSSNNPVAITERLQNHLSFDLLERTFITNVTRNPYADDTTGFGFVIRDSPVVVSEIGYLTNSTNLNGSSSSKKIYPGKYKVGSSYNDGEFTDPVTGAKRSGNYLLYFMANQAVYRQESGSNRGLDLDFAADWSPDDVNQINEQIFEGHNMRLGCYLS